MLDYFDIYCLNILKPDENNVNSPTNNFLDTINSVLNKYVPLKKVNKYKLTFEKNLVLLLVFKNQYIKTKLSKKFINRKAP